jgi:hypothetical protein
LLHCCEAPALFLRHLFSTLHVLLPTACSPAAANCHPEFDLPTLPPGSGHCFFLAILRSILLHYREAPATVSSSSLLHAGCSDNLFDQIKVKPETVIKVNDEIEKICK